MGDDFFSQIWILHSCLFAVFSSWFLLIFEYVVAEPICYLIIPSFFSIRFQDHAHGHNDHHHHHDYYYRHHDNQDHDQVLYFSILCVILIRPTYFDFFFFALNLIMIIMHHHDIFSIFRLSVQLISLVQFISLSV